MVVAMIANTRFKMLKIFFTLSLANFCLCLNQNSALYNEVFTYHNETCVKSVFAYQVVQKIFNAFKQWFFTITFCEFTYFESRILIYTENYGYGYPVMLLNGCQNLNVSKAKPKLNKHGQTAYLVTSGDLTIEDSEYAIEALTRTGVFKPRSAVIFVINVPVDIDSYFHFSMQNHFQLLWSRSITNSIIVLWSDRLRMFSYNPFNRQIKDISNVKDITKHLSEIYEDLYGHEIRLSVFRKIYTSDKTGPVKCNSIYAITIMKELNATCIPLPPRDGSTVGDFLENGTATGVTADLIDGYTDLELNSRILKNSYYGYIDTTYPFLQDELCFLIKKSMKQSTFMTILKLISIDMLLFLMFNVVIFILISIMTRNVESHVHNINDGRSTSSTVVDLIKCFIRQTVDIKFTGPIFRCLALLIMIYSLIVDCAIDGIITSAITYPRYRPDLDTISELLEANLTIAVHNRHMNLFKRSLSEEQHDGLMKRVEVVNDRKIKQIIDNREFQYAILLRKSDAEYISRKPSNMEDGRPLFHTTKECPIPCSVVFGLRYGSPYLPRLDYIFNHLNQGGILQHWVKSDEYTLLSSRHKILYVADSKEKKPLNIQNLRAVFIVWLIGLFISATFFIAEIIVSRCRRDSNFNIE